MHRHQRNSPSLLLPILLDLAWMSMAVAFFAVVTHRLYPLAASASQAMLPSQGLLRRGYQDPFCYFFMGTPVLLGIRRWLLPRAAKGLGNALQMLVALLLPALYALLATPGLESYREMPGWMLPWGVTLLGLAKYLPVAWNARRAGA